jgi:hypothetical protein
MKIYKLAPVSPLKLLTYGRPLKGVVGVNETSVEENLSIFLEFSWEKKITKIGSNQPIRFSFRRAF